MRLETDPPKVKFCQFLQGSSSAVSKPIFASENKYSFYNLVQALHDFRTFAPNQAQTSEFLAKFLLKFNKLILWNTNQLLTEFEFRSISAILTR